MNEMVRISKDEYLRLKTIEKDMADLNSAADVFDRIKAGTEALPPLRCRRTFTSRPCSFDRLDRAPRAVSS